MCGLAGIFSNGDPIYDFNLDQMIRSLSHRGPDNIEKWINKDKTVFLGHTRLSIIDLSTNANQPFHSSDGRYHITFNGEIYNYKELRNHIKVNFSKEFKSNSDTEVLIELISAYGINKATKMLNGMFAFAIWDSHKKLIHLVRDRFGEKPLFYCCQNSNLFFASEIITFLKISSIKKNICTRALSQYLRFNYIENPLSIYKNIYKLMPGTILTFNQRMIKKEYKFFNFKITNNESFSQKEASKNLENQIIKSCLSRKVSDVPIGCFLSGGIDSSLITSIIQKSSTDKIKTFTIGFDDEKIDESKYAKSIADYLGTDHHTLHISNKELIDNIPFQAQIYSEPFADQSSLATNILCRYASKSLKVILSGDGGDEMFLGYERYYQVSYLIKIIKNTSLLSQKIQKKEILRKISNFIYNRRSLPYQKDKILKLIALLIDSNSDNVYQKFNSLFRDNFFPQIPLNKNISYPYQNLETIEKMNKNDFEQYLPECILTKTDRASMHNALEVRSPFLDHNIFEIVHNLDNSNKFKLLNKKFILKKLLGNYLPKNLFDRPKKGFSAPLKSWIDGPLKEWIFDNLSENVLNSHNLFDHSIIERIKEEHYSGKRYWHNQLWNLAIFQQWYSSQK